VLTRRARQDAALTALSAVWRVAGPVWPWDSAKAEALLAALGDELGVPRGALLVTAVREAGAASARRRLLQAAPAADVRPWPLLGACGLLRRESPNEQLGPPAGVGGGGHHAADGRLGRGRAGGAERGAARRRQRGAAGGLTALRAARAARSAAAGPSRWEQRMPSGGRLRRLRAQAALRRHGLAATSVALLSATPALPGGPGGAPALPMAAVLGILAAAALVLGPRAGAAYLSRAARCARGRAGGRAEPGAGGAPHAPVAPFFASYPAFAATYADAARGKGAPDGRARGGPGARPADGAGWEPGGARKP